jgi:hypothetical protein
MNSVLVRVSLSLAQMRVVDPSEFKSETGPMLHLNLWFIGILVGRTFLIQCFGLGAKRSCDLV